MRRVAAAVALALAAVVACRSSPHVPGVDGRVAPATAERAGDGAYPIVWSRELPDPARFEVTAVYQDEVSGDAVIAGIVREQAWLGGARLDPQGVYDAVVARYDGADGTQLWTRQLSAAVRAGAAALAGDANGNTLLVGELRGDLGDVVAASTLGDIPFVAELSRATGEVERLIPFGPNAQKLGRAGYTEAEQHASWKARHGSFGPADIIYKYRSRGVLAEALPDGGVVVGGDGAGKSGLLFVVDVDAASYRRSIRWSRIEPNPTSLYIDATGRVIAAGRSAVDPETTDDESTWYLVTAIEPSDGSTIWYAPVEAETVAHPHFVVAEHDGHLLLIVSETTRGSLVEGEPLADPKVELHAIDMDGELLSVQAIRPGELVYPHAANPVYAVRGAPGARELVKLGPCPIERCSLAAR